MNSRRIKLTLDLKEFLAHPERSAFLGRTFTFCNLGRLRGYRAWGHLVLDEIQRLSDCIAAAIAATPDYPQRYSLVDLRAIESVPSECFDTFLDFSKSTREQVATQLIRQAVVRRSGMMGGVCSSFHELLRPRHQVEQFDRLDAAARWLDPPDAGELDLLVAALETGTPRPGSLAVNLRKLISSKLDDPCPALAAKALGISLRTLQRRLEREGTSFYTLLRLERVAAAQRLLLDSELKISAIALEVGFSSSQQLATCFKAVTSMTPSEFQARSRSKAARVAGAHTNIIGADTDDVASERR